MFEGKARQGLVYRETLPRSGSRGVMEKHHAEEGSSLCEGNEQGRAQAR